MSRQAQAEREKQARVILGSAEAAIAGKFVEAANIYAGHPEALQLRAMNIIYETTAGLDPQTRAVLSRRSVSVHQNTGDELVAAAQPCGARLACAKAQHRASSLVKSRGR